MPKKQHTTYPDEESDGLNVKSKTTTTTKKKKKRCTNTCDLYTLAIFVPFLTLKTDLIQLFNDNK